MGLPTALPSRKRSSTWRVQRFAMLLGLTAALLGNSCNSSTETGTPDPPAICTERRNDG